MSRDVKIKEVEKIWLNSEEAQVYLGMSKDFFCDLRKDAQLRFYKVRNTIFYKKADIDKLIEKGKVF